MAIPERIPEITPSNEYEIGFTVSTSEPIFKSTSDQSIKPNPAPQIVVWASSWYSPFGRTKNRSTKVLVNALYQISTAPANDKTAVPNDTLKINRIVNVNEKRMKSIELVSL